MFNTKVDAGTWRSSRWVALVTASSSGGVRSGDQSYPEAQIDKLPDVKTA